MAAPRYTFQLPESDIECIIDSLNHRARFIMGTYASELSSQGETYYASVLWDEYNSYVAIAHELESVLPE